MVLTGDTPPTHDRFEVQELLGRGGMGSVYRAFDRRQGRVVALKVLSSVDPVGILRFKNEFRSLADVTHPNLIRLGELFHETGAWFFTMEFVQGVDFLAHVRPGATVANAPTAPAATFGDTLPAKTMPRGVSGPSSPGLPVRFRTSAKVVRSIGYDEKRLRAALSELALGVQALHDRGLIHRDLKPSNVLVTRNDRVVILDFGLVADASPAEHAGESHIVGTPLYMAPEQAATNRVGPAADWYSVGVMLYEALTGVPPHDGGAFEVLMNKQRYEPPAPRTHCPDVPSDLEALAVSLLRFDPDARPTGAAVLERLGARPQDTPSADGRESTHTRFVGRGDELVQLDHAMASARAGRGTTVVLEGESGVGKTALCRRFLEGAHAEHGVIVLRGRCYEREQVPYKAFDGVMDDLARELSKWPDLESVLPRDALLVARIFPVLRRLKELHGTAPRLENPVEARARAFAALREILTRVARAVPLALHVDDFQWADAESVALLREVMRPDVAPPLLLLVTMRPVGDDDELNEALHNARRLMIAGLSDAEAEVLAASALGERSTAAAKIAREAKGHPLFLLELARYSREADTSSPILLSLDDAIWSRIRRLEAPARSLLEVVAAAGHPLPQLAATIAAGLDPEEMPRWIGLLKTGNLLRTAARRDSDSMEPSHDRVRETVLSRLSDETLRRVHGSLAAALEATGEGQRDPRVLVWHLVAAGERERAAAQVEEAARRASDELAFGQAAELYRMALQVTTHEPEKRQRLLAALGDSLAYAGRCPEAAEAYLGSLDSADAMWALEYRRRAAEQLLVSGHVDRGMDELRGVLEAVDIQLPTTPRRAVLSALWSRFRLWMRGLRWVERERSKIPQRDLQRLEVYKAMSLHLSIIDNVRSVSCQAQGLLVALRAGDRVHVARSLAMEAIFRANGGPRHRRAVERLMTSSRPILDQASDPFLRGWSHALHGIVSYSFGRHSEAMPSLVEGETIFRDQVRGARFELTGLRLIILSALVVQGNYRELGDRLESYLRDAARRGDLLSETTFTRGFSSAWLARDRPDEARERLASVRWMPPHTGFVDFQQYFQVVAEAELAIYERKAADVAAALFPRLRYVERSLLMYHQVARSWLLWSMGRLALASAAGGDDSHLGEARRTARKLLREGVPYAKVWSLLLSAGLAARVGREGERVALLSDVASLADTEKMPMCAAAAQRLLGTQNGVDLAQRAETWMSQEGIVNPDRMVAFIAPLS